MGTAAAVLIDLAVAGYVFLLILGFLIDLIS